MNCFSAPYKLMSDYLLKIIISSRYKGLLNIMVFACILGVPESMERDTCSPDASATCHSFAEPESVHLVPESNLTTPAMLQFSKTRKLSVERSDTRKYMLFLFLSSSSFVFWISLILQASVKHLSTCLFRLSGTAFVYTRGGKTDWLGNGSKQVYVEMGQF